MAAKRRSAAALTAAALALAAPGCVELQGSAKTRDPGFNAAGRLAQGPKLRVGVVEFRNLTPRKVADLEHAAAEILTTLLQRTGRFVVIPQQDIDALLRQQALGESGVENDATAARLGEIIGLNTALTGAITSFTEHEEGSDLILAKRKTQVTRIEVNYRLVDVTTGELLLAAEGAGEYRKRHTNVLGIRGSSTYDATLRDRALRDALAKAMEQIVGGLNLQEWSARVAAIEGEKIYLNAGQRSGLRVGARLEAYGQGKKIIDPVNQNLVGYAPGERKGALEVTELFGPDGSVAKQTLGDGLQVSDIVKLSQ